MRIGQPRIWPRARFDGVPCLLNWITPAFCFIRRVVSWICRVWRNLYGLGPTLCSTVSLVLRETNRRRRTKHRRQIPVQTHLDKWQDRELDDGMTWTDWMPCKQFCAKPKCLRVIIRHQTFRQVPPLHVDRQLPPRAAVIFSQEALLSCSGVRTSPRLKRESHKPQQQASSSFSSTQMYKDLLKSGRRSSNARPNLYRFLSDLNNCDARVNSLSASVSSRPTINVDQSDHQVSSTSTRRSGSGRKSNFKAWCSSLNPSQMPVVSGVLSSLVKNISAADD